MIRVYSSAGKSLVTFQEAFALSYYVQGFVCPFPEQQQKGIGAIKCNFLVISHYFFPGVLPLEDVQRPAKSWQRTSFMFCRENDALVCFPGFCGNICSPVYCVSAIRELKDLSFEGGLPVSIAPRMLSKAALACPEPPQVSMMWRNFSPMWSLQIYIRYRWPALSKDGNGTTFQVRFFCGK